jgi:hypothetical protein
MIVLYFDKIAITRNGKPPTGEQPIGKDFYHGRIKPLERDTGSSSSGIL